VSDSSDSDSDSNSRFREAERAIPSPYETEEEEEDEEEEEEEEEGRLGDGIRIAPMGLAVGPDGDVNFMSLPDMPVRACVGGWVGGFVGVCF
jgi:hypothetical protein